MFFSVGLASSGRQETPFDWLVERLGETFVVRDVMVPIKQVKSAKPGAASCAAQIIISERYSAVPVSEDGETFNSVFCAESEPESGMIIARERRVGVSDHIPDSTPLPEAFLLFGNREWYLTLHANRVSGLVTYWAFNSREFSVYLYTGLSRVEELSRNALVKDGYGVFDEKGLSLKPDALEKIKKRIGPMWRENGGNRFVDELDYYQVHEALSKHQPWRKFLTKRLCCAVSNGEYARRFNFTSLRDAVMHGRTLFPTYREFAKSNTKIRRIEELITHLDAYLAAPSERSL